MRPNLRSIILSTVARINSIGVIMLASTAASQSSRLHSRKLPGLGPPALVTRISGAGHTASTFARPSGVTMSAAIVMTFTPVSARILCAAASSASCPRASITNSTPSRANCCAQANPRPLLEAHTSACRPRIPKSMMPPENFAARHRAVVSSSERSLIAATLNGSPE